MDFAVNAPGADTAKSCVNSNIAVNRLDDYISDYGLFRDIMINCLVRNQGMENPPDFCASYEQYLKSVTGRLKEDLLEAYPRRYCKAGRQYRHGISSQKRGQL